MYEVNTIKVQVTSQHDSSFMVVLLFICDLGLQTFNFQKWANHSLRDDDNKMDVKINSPCGQHKLEIV